MKKRYLEKLEVLEKEIEFIKTYEIKDEVTERAILYSLQVCIEAGMDIIAMKIKDIGLTVEDDYTNIEKLGGEGIITTGEGETLKRFNGIRNAIVHKYNGLKMDIVKEALRKSDRFSKIIIKTIG